MGFVAKRGEWALKEARDTVAEVLRNPQFIFSGVRQDADEAPDGDGWLCYLARPKTRWMATGAPVPSPGDRTFLVFVTKEGIIYNWRWEASESTSVRPSNFDGRFRSQVFP